MALWQLSRVHPTQDEWMGVAGRRACGAGRGIGLAEKRSQPFKSTTVSHAADDHPRRRMLGHDRGSWRPLRGQLAVSRAGPGRRGVRRLTVAGWWPAARTKLARSPTMAYQLRGEGVKRARMISSAGRVLLPPCSVRETINMCNIWEPITTTATGVR